MDTKPTPTLAKLHISQGKYEYALAIYLYLQAKEGKSYREEISEAMTEICPALWKNYSSEVKKIFSNSEISSLRIVPDELMVSTTQTLDDIVMEFDEGGKKKEISKETAEEAIEEQADNQDKTEEVPSLGEGEYSEPEKEEVPKKETKVSSDELVPGLEEFASNYKKEVSQGLSEENNEDGEVDQKLQEDIDQKLINVLRVLRSLSSEQIKERLYKGLESGKKLEDITLADLEEIFD